MKPGKNSFIDQQTRDNVITWVRSVCIAWTHWQGSTIIKLQFYNGTPLGKVLLFVITCIQSLHNLTVCGVVQRSAGHVGGSGGNSLLAHREAQAPATTLNRQRHYEPDRSQDSRLGGRKLAKTRRQQSLILALYRHSPPHERNSPL